ncbi:hypothetical protein RMS29_004145 [Agrobacterium rosae]|uniref:Uncharacterized protein n=1 Tax=Agrobacterium rosae TaxID=1972867 RepID=A0AAE5VPQ8_9HYPH|nr:hypothetical protein [Agrobacterium rosae]MBN7807228.1 hypothetical protein [Agrobacterium rosae]MCM2433634.1 hypothetical protein [Agrobacterium rosae]MDX8303237.1 hypothetical protein [Agrobacterium rosae]MDX8317237.1 hypothetical protein [Agrobacterium rosae]MDX8329806.1 hypothetical protein [Agrobacterium rosae]
MTKIQETDPILFPSEANENKGEKTRAGRGIIFVIAGVGIMAFVVYLAMVVVMTTQSA